MADLKVDYQLLEQIRSQLGTVISNLNGIETQAGEAGAEVGSAQVANALGGFAGNWSYHRKQLLGDAQQLQTRVGAALDSFRQVDSRAATAVEGE